MTRRDTIIIAVLVNAGLLIILFASALKTDQAEPEFTSQHSTSLTPTTELNVRKEGGDELDQALGQAGKILPVAPQPSVAAPSAIATAPVAPSQSPPAVNFADDLKDFGQSEAKTPNMGAPLTEFPLAAVEKPKEGGFTEIKVKKGDVLDKIARRNHTTVEEIMKLNGLTSTRLKIGQPLRIPSKQSAVAKAPAKAPLSSEAGAKFYTVKNGDNPWTIAVKNHMKVEELLKLNNMNEEKARHLKPGDQLRIK